MSSSNSTYTTPHRSTTVNPTSVQSQFASLVQSKDQLLQLTQQTEQAYQTERQNLTTLTQTQTRLSQQIQTAHAQLGIHRRKKDLVVNEQRRLRELIKKERKEMEELTEQACQVEKLEERKKEEFVKEMEGLNRELTDVLRRYEEAKVQDWIMADSSDMNIDSNVDENADANTDVDTTWNFEDATASVQVILHFMETQVAAQDPSEQWVHLLELTKEAVKGFVATLERKEACWKEHHSLKEKCAMLRSQILQGQNNQGMRELELDQLEAIWQQHPWEDSNVHTNSMVENDPKTMMTGHDSNGVGMSNVSNTSRMPSRMSPVNVEGREPSNMELFYGVDDSHAMNES